VSSELDWTRLEAAVARAVARLRAVTEENRSLRAEAKQLRSEETRLRAEVTRLEAELQSALATPPPPAEGALPTAEVRRRLALLEGEIESLLAS
jgi:multidrug resistance efflux pump